MEEIDEVHQEEEEEDVETELDVLRLPTNTFSQYMESKQIDNNIKLDLTNIKENSEAFTPSIFSPIIHNINASPENVIKSNQQIMQDTISIDNFANHLNNLISENNSPLLGGTKLNSLRCKHCILEDKDKFDQTDSL